MSRGMKESTPAYPAPAGDAEYTGGRPSPWRWWVLTLLFFATTINYLDRIVLSVLAHVIRDDLHFSDREYGYITAAFQVAYMIGYLALGKLVDRVGTRIGYSIVMIWWSAAAVLHVISRSAFGLGFWRAMLGLGESGNYPAGVKVVAEWFPAKDRGFAVGLFNSGTNVAAVLGPPLFVAMNIAYGWRSAFVLTGASGFMWLLLWWFVYRHPERQERESNASVSWMEALRDHRTVGLAALKFLTDGVWWFYLFWLPLYLFDARKLDLNHIGWALPAIYVMAGFGSIGGGWLADFWIRRGWTPPRARRAVLAIVAVCMPIAALNVFASNMVLAIALISLATAAHQGWAANLFITPSDFFPKEMVASVVGIAGCAGGLGGLLFSALIPGYVVTNFGYVPMFVLAGVLHPIAWLVGNRLLWREPAGRPV
jgi:ACS family hexuronate transporter-like MFS transporter